MPLTTLKAAMDYARSENCAIGMFNVVTADYAEAIVGAAEESGMPVIVGMPERFFQFYSMDRMTELALGLAEKAAVPVVVHLDHGKNFETVMQVLRRGFTSVMFDGSALDYDENVEKTAEIAKIAHAMGVSVEGELGYIGQTSSDKLDGSLMTKPSQARDFAERTGVDALAVAIGNMHGHYRGVPKLDFDRLAEIKKAVSCGLVLHGGSGISEADFRRAARAGVNKINIYTALSDYTMNFFKEKLGKYPMWLDMSKDMREGLKELIKSYILLFGCKRQPN